ncbi:hypothetical protein KCU73_g75, partial [Aureobasidium melanogenum]
MPDLVLLLFLALPAQSCVVDQFEDAYSMISLILRLWHHETAEVQGVLLEATRQPPSGCRWRLSPAHAAG